MSSRAEEKEKRRQERLAAEQAAAAGAKRLRLVQIGVGVVLGIAIIVGVVIAVAGGGGDDGGSGSSSASASSAPIPARTDAASPGNLTAAAKAAGCTFKEFPSEGREHANAVNNNYKTNPPTSGTHNPVPAEDGIYDPRNSPAKEHWVHTLEHGRIILQYKPGTPQKVRDQLATLFNEDVQGKSGYHMVLLENNTDMPDEVTAVAWTRSISCPTVNDKTWDALRSFRDRFVDKAPELIP